VDVLAKDNVSSRTLPSKEADSAEAYAVGKKGNGALGGSLLQSSNSV
jgi:hypothetical protein